MSGEVGTEKHVETLVEFGLKQELKATKRALWLARAERAKVEKEHYVAVKFTECKPSTKRRRDMDRIAYKWEWVELKCREKAEEYK